MSIIVTFLLMGKIFKLKADNKDINFPTLLCLGNLSNEFYVNESREVFSKENFHGFSAEYNATGKSKISNI